MKEQIRTYPIFFWKLLYNRQLKPMDNLKKDQIEVVTIDTNQNNYQESSTLILRKEIKEIEYFSLNLDEGVTLDMVTILGGKFMMGTPTQEQGRSKDETPEHDVNINNFFVSQYPITQSQYQAVMKENPSFFQGNNKPVENVSWVEAQNFCQQLSQLTGKKYRLLSEAEWEYICRGNTSTSFCYGKTITSELANYKANFGYGLGGSGKWRQETTEVGIFPANSFGLYDVHGNVWEWCEDHWHENYINAPDNGKPWLEEDNSTEIEELPRVIRGGSWDDTAYYCRSGVRLWALPNFKGKLIGFRIAVDYD